jgi:hypothetical protein
MSAGTRSQLWNFFRCLYENQLTESADKIAQPEWIKTPMLDHQRASVAAALKLEKGKVGFAVDPVHGEEYGGTYYTSYGILGDRVGSGKSLTAMALLKQPAPADTFVEYVMRNSEDKRVGLMRTRTQDKSMYGSKMRALTTSLIIVPHAIVSQWEEYVKNDTNLNILFIKKQKDAQDEALFAKLEEYDAVCVTSTMYRMFEVSHPTETVLWNRVFIDEADSIAVTIPYEHHLNARFYWLITASWMNCVFSNGSYLNIGSSLTPPEGTPADIVKKVKSHMIGEYFSIGGIRTRFIQSICGNLTAVSYGMNKINPAVFQSARNVIHCTEGYIRKSFDIPDIKHVRILCKTPANIAVLNEMVSNDMMERLNAGDTEGVLEMLGMRTRSAEEVAGAITDSIQKELEQVQLLYNFKKTVTYSSEHAKNKALEHLEDKMARLKSRIEAIEGRLKNVVDESCPICFCDIVSPALTPCCRNLFCFGCICASLKQRHTCPLCREIIADVQSLQVLGSGDKKAAPVDAAAAAKPKSKAETLRAFLAENPTARVLMFSGYDATFSSLTDMLVLDGIPHATLSGTNARISRLIKDFEKGKFRVLFLNAKNMGAGLNIRPATHVVLYHRMPIETQNQIIGRAVRLGRTEPLTVVHLLHGNEMDGVGAATEEVEEESAALDAIQYVY